VSAQGVLADRQQQEPIGLEVARRNGTFETEMGKWRRLVRHLVSRVSSCTATSRMMRYGRGRLSFVWMWGKVDRPPPFPMPVVTPEGWASPATRFPAALACLCRIMA